MNALSLHYKPIKQVDMIEKIKKELTRIAESLNFNITISEDEDVNISFAKTSSYGQDFNFEISVDKDAGMFGIWRELQSYQNNFDVSAEAYLWLDESGHGKNGAPFEMIDVYKDMEECKGFVTELADNVFDKIFNQN